MTSRSNVGVWVALVVVAVVGATLLLRIDHARAWHYFASAADLLFEPSSPDGGLEMYRAHPEFQFGPLAVLVASVFVGLPDRFEVWSVMVVGAVAGVGVVAVLLDTPRQREDGVVARHGQWAVLAIGLPFLYMWLRLSAYTAHIDDVVALCALVASGAFVQRGRGGWATVALFVAAAAKPWAVIFAPMAALVPGRFRLVRPLVVAALSVGTWMPFLLGAPGTFEALRGFVIDVNAASGLRVLGLADVSTPGWVRPVQFGLGIAMTSAVVLLRRSWSSALLAGVCVRLLFDPATLHYYSVAFVIAALAWELDRFPTQLPWRTLVATLVLELASSGVMLGGLMPYLRFLLLLAALGVSVTTPGDDARPRSGRRTSGSGGRAAPYAG